MIYLIATLTIKPGSLDNLLENAAPCIDATRRELGCISYDLHQSTTDESKLVFVETWQDRAALEAHFKEPHLNAWRKAAEPHLLSTKIEIIEPASVEQL